MVCRTVGDVFGDQTDLARSRTCTLLGFTDLRAREHCPPSALRRSRQNAVVGRNQAWCALRDQALVGAFEQVNADLQQCGDRWGTLPLAAEPIRVIRAILARILPERSASGAISQRSSEPDVDLAKITRPGSGGDVGGLVLKRAGVLPGPLQRSNVLIGHLDTNARARPPPPGEARRAATPGPDRSRAQTC